MSDPSTHPEEQSADREYVEPGEESEVQPDERHEQEEADVLLEEDDHPDPIVGP